MQVFTRVDELYLFNKKNKIDILIISESVYAEEIHSMNINHVVILAEEGILSKDELFILQKYQSSEKIIHEILYYYARLNESSIEINRKLKNIK